MEDENMDNTSKSTYELLREKNIRERESMLASMFSEIEDFSKEFVEDMEQPKKPKPRKRKSASNDRTVRPTTRRSLEVRRSSRNTGVQPKYSHDDFPETINIIKNPYNKQLISKYAYQKKPQIERANGSFNPDLPATPPTANSKTSEVRPPDEISEEEIANIAQRAGKKIYSKDGSSCHQCRQKTTDTKTVCRSGSCVGIRGQFCGPCLKNRYGELAADALKDPHWHCPPCRNLCNCSICRIRAGKTPTGILAPAVLHEGFSSVQDYLVTTHEISENLPEKMLDVDQKQTNAGVNLHSQSSINNLYQDFNDKYFPLGLKVKNNNELRLVVIQIQIFCDSSHNFLPTEDERELIGFKKLYEQNFQPNMNTVQPNMNISQLNFRVTSQLDSTYKQNINQQSSGNFNESNSMPYSTSTSTMDSDCVKVSKRKKSTKKKSTVKKSKPCDNPAFYEEEIHHVEQAFKISIRNNERLYM